MTLALACPQCGNDNVLEFDDPVVGFACGEYGCGACDHTWFPDDELAEEQVDNLLENGAIA
jgi:hypothetical protein